MTVIADLHIHSRFSRACSSQITVPNLERYARMKGIDLLGTGDFTHPLWNRELKGQLKDDGSGILATGSGFKFMLTTEIANIFTQGGMGRRVHNVILAPDFEAVDRINAALLKRGRLDYDGRPMFGFSCAELVSMMKDISDEIEVIPAHCLPANSYIHTRNGLKKISEIVVGEEVLTHVSRYKRVTKTFSRKYSGKLYKIIPWYFSGGLATTPEHPFLAVKSKKSCAQTKGLCKPLCCERSHCKERAYEKYKLGWIPAECIEVGDFIAFPRPKSEIDIRRINMAEYVNGYKVLNGSLLPKQSRNNRNAVKSNIMVDENFCRLIGYYLSEGFVARNDVVGFSFSSKEKEYADDVIRLMDTVFGLSKFKIDPRRKNQLDVMFFSQLLNEFFKSFYCGDEKRAWNKYLPWQFISLPNTKLSEIVRGWWRGDKGYTVSRRLFEQMKIICLKLGIIPSLHIDTAENYNRRGKHFIDGREIIAKRDLFTISNLSFFEEDYGMLKERCFARSVNKIRRKHGWIDSNYAYLPVRRILTQSFSGKVYNLEVEDDNSYVHEHACVHNCWTPWFGVFGSESGFDSLKEAFQEQEKNIYSIETGMSSDPDMNWHISELNNRSIVSFSDAHSFWPWRLGREATIFDKANSYKDIIRAIREKKITGTIETDPAYGKYHWDGHRLCNFSCPPSESKRLKGVCPVCGKGLTIGVEYRVGHISDQPVEKHPNRKPYHKMLPLHELIAAAKGWSVASRKTWEIYNKLISHFGNEFNVLLEASEKDVTQTIPNEKLLTKLIMVNRKGEIKVRPGFDGVYGTIVIGGREDARERKGVGGLNSGSKAKHRQKGLSDFVRTDRR